MRLLIALTVFCCLLGALDRRLWKANHGFSLSIIETSMPLKQSLKMTAPQEIFKQSFYYLGRGSQSFVFESEDKKTVLKFYRFPSHLRKIPWAHHPFGYLFSSKRQKIKAYNLKKLHLSLHSFCLAAEPLSKETGVLYVHLAPTSELCQKVHLIDRRGSHYYLPLDPLTFIIQKKGAPFLSVFKTATQEMQKQMLDSLIMLIAKRCEYNITDLDNMDNDNYGWGNNEAMHLDIGRFQEKADLNAKDEILRITHPLIRYLADNHLELHAFYLERVDLVAMGEGKKIKTPGIEKNNLSM